MRTSLAVVVAAVREMAGGHFRKIINGIDLIDNNVQRNAHKCSSEKTCQSISEKTCRPLCADLR